MNKTAETLFYNGKVYTADKQGSWVDCVAVADGRIIYTGILEGGEPFCTPVTQLIDLKGGTLLPGFMDTHAHIPGIVAHDLFSANLNGIENAEDIEKKIKEFIKTNPDAEIYYGNGFNSVAFSEGEEKLKGPSKKRLDAIEPNKPVVIVSYDVHSRWLNSAALEKFGITPDTPVPSGGYINRDDETGELWGTLGESAIGLVPAQEMTPAMRRKALLAYQERMIRWGCVAVTAMAAFEYLDESIWPLLKEMEESGELKLHVNGTVYIDPKQDFEEQLAFAKYMREKYSSDRLSISGVKLFADGVVDCHTACMVEPYTDQPGLYGEFLWDTGAMADAIVRANTEGFQVHVHCIGDGATTRTLDAYELAITRLPKGDYRNAITHLIIVNGKDIPRFKKLDLIASIQPYWALKMPHYWTEVERPFLGERCEKMYPFKDFKDAGVLLASSSDEPGTPVPYPLGGIQAGVTRTVVKCYAGSEYALTHMDEKPEYVLWPEQRLSVKDMVDSFTVNNAFFTRVEDRMGSIEVGKNADFVQLDRDIFTVNPVTIEDAVIEATYIYGKPVYQNK